MFLSVFNLLHVLRTATIMVANKISLLEARDMLLSLLVFKTTAIS